jgi:hypothetical protein
MSLTLNNLEVKRVKYEDNSGSGTDLQSSPTDDATPSNNPTNTTSHFSTNTPQVQSTGKGT